MGTLWVHPKEVLMKSPPSVAPANSISAMILSQPDGNPVRPTNRSYTSVSLLAQLGEVKACPRVAIFITASLGLSR